MVLMLAIPRSRKITGLEDFITNALQNSAKVMLATGLIVAMDTASRLHGLVQR